MTLQVTDRPSRLLSEIEDLEKHIYTAVFIGNRCKREAIHMFGAASFPHTRHSPFSVDICTLHTGLRNKGPTFITDIEVPTKVSTVRLPQPHKSRSCHDARHIPLNLQSTTSIAAEEELDRIIQFTLFPLAHLVCIFVEDVGGVHEVVRRISRWVDRGHPSTNSIKPVLLLVTETSSEVEFRSKLKGVMEQEALHDFSSVFYDIRVVSLTALWPQTRRPPTFLTRWDRLRRVSDVCLEQSKRRFESHRLLFSARHTISLFQDTLHTALDKSKQAFDFVRTSRLRNEVPNGLQSHITNFLGCIKNLNDLTGQAIPIISSSLILNHYPPGQHGNFSHRVSEQGTNYWINC